MHHPFMRAGLLALALTAGLTLGMVIDRSSSPAQLAMIPVGAALAAAPGRIIRRKQPRPVLRWRRCVLGFLGGLGGMLGAMLASGGAFFHGTTALGAGSLAGATFLLAAWLTARLYGWAQRRTFP